MDDKIFRIETFSEGTKVFQEIDIGCSLDVIETFLGFKLEFDEDPANDGITDIYLDGFKYTLYSVKCVSLYSTIIPHFSKSSITLWWSLCPFTFLIGDDTREGKMLLATKPF